MQELVGQIMPRLAEQNWREQVGVPLVQEVRKWGRTHRVEIEQHGRFVARYSYEAGPRFYGETTKITVTVYLDERGSLRDQQ
ncbi:hypothetical protein Raf01_90690 [Rugosimonospora africana]|uniref:Uncharacterized protein n=1 Tax=Rugosimonospora africana TaxID=556532 RepID=A0A8J3R3P1_9ACTN|nr:hypothetical protein Raf01_90690 [Rugosimonospora africana]